MKLSAKNSTLKVLFLCLLVILASKSSWAQSAAINTDGSSADPSAALDIKSTVRGLLIPRMSNADRTALVNPATSLIIFQNDGVPGYYYNSGTPGAPVWVQLLPANGNGSLLTNLNAAALATGIVPTARLGSGAANSTSFLRGDSTWAPLSGILSGTLNFIPKFTPSGSALGDSQLFDDGTFVGVGTNTPAYRFDVLHGGAGGARIKSTAAFSTLDIDAANGDAALRYQSAGTTRWNVRNQPGTNDYQIVRNNALPANLTINNGTGFVGITESTPAYQLDVLHGGSSGIRSRSSSSFSVIDIDGANGDAALRFQKAGAGQWNTRNRPADDYYEIFELGGGGSRFVIQDGTGNVGIGETTNPTYKLDVLHGGATGARVRSSSTFSILDIDGANGDAALRFAKAGVNQWNVRNRPADDYFEVFELGGGGSRMVIQDGTGNVGIGETTNPTYKLDVLHGGATGIRSRSSGTFSVIDIDGANGDAALRFQKAGVNQWNIRNDPANDNLQIFELGGGGERLRIEDGTGKVVVTGDLHVAGTLSKAAGAFKIDHPLDPENKYLVHSFVESPDMMNIYNGNIVTDANGKATVELPDYFEALNMEFRYQLTVIGAFEQAIVNKEVSKNQFEIATSKPNVKVSWQVTGIRHDAYADKNRLPNTIDKEANNKGKYLNPEAFGLPSSKRIGYSDPIAEEQRRAANGAATGPSSLDQAPIVPAKAAPATTGGSLDQAPVVNSKKEIPTKGGSLDQPAITAPKPKSVETSGSVKP